MPVDVLRVLPNGISSPSSRALEKISRAEAVGLLEAAYLATAANGDLSNEEAAEFTKLVPAIFALAGETSKPPTNDELRVMLDGFDLNLRHQLPRERIMELAPTLERRELRDLAYKLSFALSLCDLATDDDEADFLEALAEAFGLTARVDELSAAVYSDLDADAEQDSEDPEQDL